MAPALFLVLALSRQAVSFSDEWSQIRTAITNSYYARTTRGPEMQRLLDEYAAKVSGAKSDDEFEADVNAMISAFGDSHFSYLSRSDQTWYLMDALSRGDKADPMPNIGAWFVPAADGYQVQMVLDGMAAMKAGIRKGDVVQSVDGQAFRPVDSLRSRVGTDVSLTVLRDGRTLSKSVKVSSERASDMFLQASENSAQILQDGGRRIGYFHLWTMAGEEFRRALSGALLGKLQDTDGFILDLRDGFGGRPEGYSDPFFRPDVDITWVQGDHRSVEPFGYGRPLVVLINHGSRSAEEILSYLFKASHRATLIGSTTAGNVLGTSPFHLHNGAYLEIPIVDVFVNGSRLEGKGVPPDVAISPEYDRDGKDLDLAAALDRLKNVPEHPGLRHT